MRMRDGATLGDEKGFICVTVSDWLQRSLIPNRNDENEHTSVAFGAEFPASALPLCTVTCSTDRRNSAGVVDPQRYVVPILSGRRRDHETGATSHIFSCPEDDWERHEGRALVPLDPGVDVPACP